MRKTSRRDFLRGSAAAGLAATPVLRSWAANPGITPAERGPAQGTLSLDDGWLFGGRLQSAALESAFNDSAFEHVSVPHCLASLSWRDWSPAQWQDIWVYRRHFSVPPSFQGLRLFLRFDRVMAAAAPVLNGHTLPQHVGGFLPFEYEITDLVKESGNVLAVAVDARWLNAPPSGSPKGPESIDYLLPGGIIGHVRLYAVPRIFLREVFARPVHVLSRENRRIDITCRLSSVSTAPLSAFIEAKLLGHGTVIATTRQKVSVEQPDKEIRFSIGGLEQVELWHVDTPRLYDLDLTLHCDALPVHTFRTRVGFREARFDVDGFFLNGERKRIFGLNRHELFPYAGFAMPDRVQRRDAEMLRHTLHCNMVRCSHYPQSEAFLDACDELGLMVWEEVPGWWYVGDETWQQLLLRDVDAMVRRDRNHPSVVIWGVRANESLNQPDLYRRTRAVAKSLDDSRPTSGTMTPWSKKNWQQEWHQDVFAYDDYHSAPDGSVGIDPPLAGVPYLVTESVGQCNYGGQGMSRRYRRAGDAGEQALQAIYHAQAHDKAAGFPRCAGLIAWCAFDYASLSNGYKGVKCPGIADVFRLPKLGAAFYMTQVDPAVRPMIEPDFYWDFGPQTPAGPGMHAAIFSNCNRLELFLDGTHYATVHPDHEGFPHLAYPPFFADLRFERTPPRELRIEGFVGADRAITRSFSADSSADQLWLQADDNLLQADGSDATRLAFGVVDKFGAPRAFAQGHVTLRVEGPAILVGENPFELADAGGLGAVWIRTISGRPGKITVNAEHSSLGHRSIAIEAQEPPSLNK